MSSPVSVIIPALNEEHRIASAIDSSFAAGAAEVIVADGGSSDATIAIAREHGARSVQLNTEQRSRIHDVFVRDRSRFDRFRVSRVDFDVRPGVRIPRHVHLFSVPSDIVSVVPAYRGYRFFYYEEELVIVDPVTLEIVAVIPA